MEGYLNCYFEKKVFERYFCILDLQKGCLLCYTDFKSNESEGVMPEDLELEVPLTSSDHDGAEKRTVVRALGDKERDQYGKGKNGMFVLSNAAIGFNYAFEVAPHNARNPRDIFPKSTMWVDAISFAICTCNLTEDDEKSLCKTLDMEYSRKFDRQNVKAAFMAKQKGVDPIRQTRLDEVNNAKKALMFIGERHEYFRLNHHNRFTAELIMRRSEKTGLLSLGLDFKCEENASVLRIKSIDTKHILFLDNSHPPDYIQVNDVLESINGIDVLHYSVHGIKSMLSEHRIPEDCSVTLGFNRLTPKTASEILAMLEVEKAEDLARQAGDIAKAAIQAANMAHQHQQKVQRQIMHLQSHDLVDDEKDDQQESKQDEEEHKSQVSSLPFHHLPEEQERGPLIAKIALKGLHGEDLVLKVYEKNSTAQIRRFLTRHGIHGGPLVKMIDVIHEQIKIEEDKFRMEQELKRPKHHKKKEVEDHEQDQHRKQLRFEQQLEKQRLQQEVQQAASATGAVEAEASSIGSPPSIMSPASINGAVGTASSAVIRPLPVVPLAAPIVTVAAAEGSMQQGSITGGSNAGSKAGSKRPPPLFTAHELLDDPSSAQQQHDVPREIHLTTIADKSRGKGSNNEEGSQHSELTQSVIGSLPATVNASGTYNNRASLNVLAREGLDTAEGGVRGGMGMSAVYEEEADEHNMDDIEADQRSYESMQRMYFHNNTNTLPQAVDDTFVISTGRSRDGSAAKGRQRARSHSPTSTSSHVRKVDAQVFRRLYEDAARVRSKREKLRGRFEEELQHALESSSFRHQLARISPHRQFTQDREVYRLQHGMTLGEQIYESQMLWKERRDKAIAEKLSKQEKERALIDYQMMQDKPHLQTSFAMQRRNRHETQSQLVERLYNTDLQSRQHQLLLTETYKSTFHQEQAYFIPKISAYSRKLAEKQRQRVAHQPPPPPPPEFMTPVMNSPYGYHEEHEILVMNEDEMPSLSKMIASSNNRILSSSQQQQYGSKVQQQQEDEERHELDMDVIHLLRQDDGGGTSNSSPQQQKQQQVTPTKALITTNNNNANNKAGKPPRSPSPSKKPSLFVNPHAPSLHKQALTTNGSNYTSEEESVYPYVDSTTSATAKAARERGRSFTQARSQSQAVLARSVSPSFMSHKFSQQSLSQLSQSPQRAISPLYDRLYSFKSQRTLQRVETVKELIKLECPHTPSLDATSRYNKHSPAITERKKASNNNPFNDVQDQRQDLYNKLNEDAKERARRLSLQRQAIADEIRAASNHGKRPLTDEENDQLVCRLITKAQKVQAKVAEKKMQIQQKQKMDAGQRFIQSRSSRIANKKLVYALIEIFNVLRVTVQYKKDMIAVQDAIIAANAPPSPGSTTAMMPTAPATSRLAPQVAPLQALPQAAVDELMPAGRSMSGSPTFSDSEPSTQLPRSPLPGEPSSPSQHHRVEPARSVIEINRESANNATSTAVLEDDGLLDAKLADAKQLQPPALASAMTMALAACPQHRAVTQTEFIDLVMDLMQRGKLPPIAYMLVHPTSDTDEKLLTQSAEAREMREVLDKPSLAAAKTTNALVKERYRDRIQGKQTVHDSLRDYRDFYTSRAEDRKLQRVLDEDRECTFQPALIAASMQEAQREHVERRRRMRDEQKKQKQRATSTPR